MPDERIISKIYLVRDKKVMLDSDLAELYGVETRVLKQAVRRNKNRFPEDFMFELTEAEWKTLNSFLLESDPLRSQSVILETGRGKHSKYKPFVFTEQGVAMLSSVLNSDRAIMVNIQIIRVFTKMRQLVETHKEILLKLEQLEKKDIEQDEKLILIFEYLKQLEEAKEDEMKNKDRKQIGYKRKNEK
ncbi:MAG: ORF6N domain-containing protein [Bacteroidales bacterium]|nr:ORF6N domain-containing protein [Bacteroidales bacterium]